MSRDDFSPKTITAISQRAAYRCSFPTCRRFTLAACAQDPKQSTNIGKVAHITAAAPGGPRFDSTLTPDQRSAPENAIFLCTLHADLIDKNQGVDYPVEQLRAWKQSHEQWTISQLHRPQDAQLQIADIFVNNEGYNFPAVDVRLLNLGTDPVCLTRGVVTTLEHIILPTNRRGSRLSQSWSYTVEIGENTGNVRNFELSQIIPPKDADRFQLVFKGAYPLEDVALNLYVLDVVLLQGASGQCSISLPQILLHMPCEAKPLAVSTMPYTKESLKKIRQTAKTLSIQIISELAHSVDEKRTIYCDALVADALCQWAAIDID